MNSQNRSLIRDTNRLYACFFTGREVPAVEKEKKISHYDKTAFWQEIMGMRGLPKEVLENEELIDFFEPIIRADFQAVEDYEYRPMKKPFQIPICIRAGNKEDIPYENLTAWQMETLFPIDVQVLPGDHFFIFDHPRRIADQIVKVHLTTIAKSI